MLLLLRRTLPIHGPNVRRTCRLSPIFQFAKKRDVSLAICDQSPWTGTGTSAWWAAQCRDISRTDSVICHGGLPGFHRREPERDWKLATGHERSESGARARVVASSDSSFLRGKLRGTGCHGRRTVVQGFTNRDSAWTTSATNATIVSRFVRDMAFEFDVGITRPISKERYRRAGIQRACSFVCLSIGTFVGWSISPMALRLFD